MIEKIIHSYLYDEESWNGFFMGIHEQNFEEIKPLLDSSFVNDFTYFHGFHDWILESIQMEFQKAGFDVVFQLSDIFQKKHKLRFVQCNGFRLEGVEEANYQYPNQVQIISFEKRSEVCIGIASTSGLVAYIFCELPFIRLE